MKSAEKKEVCEAFSDVSRRYALAMDLLNKQGNAYWFRKAEAAYTHGYYRLGSFFMWMARRNMYKQDWQDILLFIQYGKI